MTVQHFIAQDVNDDRDNLVVRCSTCNRMNRLERPHSKDETRPAFREKDVAEFLTVFRNQHDCEDEGGDTA